MKISLPIEFFSDLKEIEDELHPFDFCEQCGIKRKLTLDSEGSQAWCNQCWKDWEAFEKKEYNI